METITDASGNELSLDRTQLICGPADPVDYTTPKSVCYVGNLAFCKRTSLRRVTISEGVTDIGSDAFEGCSSLTEVDLPESLEVIHAGAFNGCESLPHLRIPSNVHTVGAFAFRGCTSLATVFIPEGLMPNEFPSSDGIVGNVFPLTCNVLRPAAARLYLAQGVVNARANEGVAVVSMHEPSGGSSARGTENGRPPSRVASID